MFMHATRLSLKPSLPPSLSCHSPSSLAPVDAKEDLKNFKFLVSRLIGSLSLLGI
ncbi:hypothetical protein HanIR_Chr02g0059881 [Helianthus annuus]|nr:hypothetical protein HanIR_Chr02g0059881 [Helianthus annuus]